MILHTLSIKECHLFLDSSKDAGVTSMEAYNEMSLVIVLLHQRTLFFECHIG